MVIYPEPRGPWVLPVGELVLWYGMLAPCGRLLVTMGFAHGAPLMQTCLSSLSFRLHRFFAADDITGIDAPTDFIDHDAESTNTAFISLTLFHTLLGNLFCYFFLSHGFLLL